MMMAAQVVVRTGDAAAVVVEVLVAACCPAVEWREKNRSGSWRRHSSPEAAETDLRATGHDHHAGVCAHRVESRVERELGGNGTAGAHPSAP